jgi:hypothetical protein
VRLFVDPLHGEKQHDPAKTWFEPLNMDGDRVAILRMRVAISGDGSISAVMRREARFLFNIGCQEFVCAVLGDVEDWYSFSPVLYIPPHQSFDGMLQTSASVADRLERNVEHVEVRVTFDIRYGREVL